MAQPGGKLFLFPARLRFFCFSPLFSPASYLTEHDLNDFLVCLCHSLSRQISHIHDRFLHALCHDSVSAYKLASLSVHLHPKQSRSDRRCDLSRAARFRTVADHSGIDHDRKFTSAHPRVRTCCRPCFRPVSDRIAICCQQTFPMFAPYFPRSPSSAIAVLYVICRSQYFRHIFQFHFLSK